MMHFIRRYIIAGLLFWLPIWVTLLVIGFLVDLLDGTVSLLPKAYQPVSLIGFDIPGLGIVISLVIVILTGMVVANFLGKRLVNYGEAIVKRIPFVSSVYTASKQVVETLFSADGQSFRKVFLVEYPRKGMWSFAFQTGTCSDEVQGILDNEEMITLFIPTTPNPTAGFLLLVPVNEAIELKMTVDQALKFVFSLGVIQPSLSETLKTLEKAKSFGGDAKSY